jgi:Trypsin-like peptidase domain
MSRTCPPVVLVTVTDGKLVLAAGTGFVIREDKQASYVMTCAHVLSEMGESNVRVGSGGTQQVRLDVNGTRVDEILLNAEIDGVDIALVRVPGPLGVQSPQIQPLAAKGGKFACTGFTAFRPGEYAERQIRGTIQERSRVLTRSGRELRYWTLVPNADGHMFEKGISGAPVVDAQGRVFGVAQARVDDGKLAYAICVSSIEGVWRDELPCFPFGGGGITGRRRAGQSPKSATRPEPNETPIRHPEDPQKGRWGGKSRRGNRELVVRLVVQYHRWFVFDAIVRSTDPAKPLEGPFVYHLHDTYPKSVIWVWKTKADGSARLEEIESTGVYTIAVQVKDERGKWIGLELDLAKELKSQGLEKRFLDS